MAEPRTRPGGYVLWLEGEKITEVDMERVGSMAIQGITSFFSRLFRDDANDDERNAFAGADCLVTNPSALNLSVAVGVGFYDDEAAVDQFAPIYRPIVVPTAISLTVGAHHATLPRIDIVCIAPALVDDESASVSVKNPTTGVLSTQSSNKRRIFGSTAQVVAGTAASTPSAPSTPTGYIKLCEVDVPATSGALVLRDYRRKLQLSEGLVSPGHRDHHQNFVPGTSTELNVTQRPIATMGLLVAAGEGHIYESRVKYDGGGATITTADATNPRRDLVCLLQDGTIAVTAGTPAATPTVPSTPANAALLAIVHVGAGVTSILTANIHDARTRAPVAAANLGTPIPSLSAAAESGNSITVSIQMVDGRGGKICRAVRLHVRVVDQYGRDSYTSVPPSVQISGSDGTQVVPTNHPTTISSWSMVLDTSVFGTATIAVGGQVGVNQGVFLQVKVINEHGGEAWISCPFT